MWKQIWDFLNRKWLVDESDSDSKKTKSVSNNSQGEFVSLNINKKILVVDDERSVVQLIQSILERHGCTVIPSFDGKKALAHLELDTTDLIILDLTLPDLNGEELLQILKHNPGTKDVPVLMLRAKTTDASIDDFRQISGVDGNLIKPFTPELLARSVKRIFDYQEFKTDRDHAENGVQQTKSETILAVDDETSIVRLIKVVLNRQGYKVIYAYNGLDALTMAETEKPDIIILDTMMPVLDGFEVLEKVKNNPGTKDIPVIMLTARSANSDIFVGYKSGVDCYLTKPFNPMELISFVKRIFSALDDKNGTHIG